MDDSKTHPCRLCKTSKPRCEMWVRKDGGLNGLCLSCRRVERRDWNRLNGRANVLRKFGLTPAAYDAMLAAQGGVCAVCRGVERRVLFGKVVPLSVDHDHTTGRVRALLCSFCNIALGHLAEDPGRIRALADYAERVCRVQRHP